MTGVPAAVPAVVIDHHVHLQLVEARSITGLARVVDLGAGPDLDLSNLRSSVDRVGCFLTAPGGYPADRSWAPRGSVREVSSAADARAAVAEQVLAGARALKVTLHAEAGPVLEQHILRAIVEAAGALPVVAHAEGPGMAQLALTAGCDALAHTPFTERLPDQWIAAAAAAGQKWISTLAIHLAANPLDTPALLVALDNLARFHAAGGVVLYGTDLGNGDLPLGVNRVELGLLARAGLDEAAIAAACAHPWPHLVSPS